MPPTLRDNKHWLEDRLAGAKADADALKAQQTQFIVDASGVCQAIIGSISKDPKGTATGLSGFGVAVWTGSVWVEVPAGLLVAANNLSDVASAAAARTNLAALGSASNLSDVASRATALVNLGVARGSTTFSFSASVTSGILTINHGLAGTPTSVQLTISQTANAGLIPEVVTGSKGSTSFQAICFANASLSQTIAVDWTAVL